MQQQRARTLYANALRARESSLFYRREVPGIILFSFLHLPGSRDRYSLRRSLGKRSLYVHGTAPEHARATRAPSHPNCRVPRSVGFRPQTPFQSTQTQPACRRARFPNSPRRRAYGAQSAPSSRTLVCACVRADRYGRTGRWGCGWGSSPDAAAPIRTRPFGETRGARTAL